MRKAGCEVRELHAEVNPNFGGLHPEPILPYMGPLIDHVRGWDGPGIRVGFAFDGDSDRIAPVDEDGAIVTPHQVLALLVRHLARNRKEQGTIVKSVNIGHMVDLEAAALGLPLVVTPIGFKFIAAAMQEQDALVGGEESGGFAVRGHIPERDPGLICLLLLECMAATGKSLGTLVQEMESDYGTHRYGRVDLRLATLADRDRVVAQVTNAPPPRLLDQARAAGGHAGRRQAGPGRSELGHAAGVGDGAAPPDLRRGAPRRPRSRRSWPGGGSSRRGRSNGS